MSFLFTASPIGGAKSEITQANWSEDILVGDLTGFDAYSSALLNLENITQKSQFSSLKVDALGKLMRNKLIEVGTLNIPAGQALCIGGNFGDAQSDIMAGFPMVGDTLEQAFGQFDLSFCIVVDEATTPSLVGASMIIDATQVRVFDWMRETGYAFGPVIGP